MLVLLPLLSPWIWRLKDIFVIHLFNCSRYFNSVEVTLIKACKALLQTPSPWILSSVQQCVIGNIDKKALRAIEGSKEGMVMGVMILPLFD